MDHALLWLEAMAASLLLVALGRTYSSRVFAWLIWCIPALTGMAAVAAGIYLRTLGISPDWIAYSSGWTAAYALIGVWLMHRDPQLGPSRGLLIGSDAFASMLLLLTFDIVSARIDARLIGRAAVARAELASIAPHPIPDAENAAVVYAEAIAWLDALQDAPLWLQQGTRPPSIGDPEVDTWLERSQPAVRRFREASAMSGHYLAGTTTIPLGGDVMALVGYRRLAVLVALDAERCAHRGQLAVAANDVASIWRTAGHLEQSPFVIGLGIALGVQWEGTHALETVLSSSEAWTPAQLRVLRAALPPTRRPSLELAYASERAFVISSIGDSVTPGFSPERGVLYAMPLLGPVAKVFLIEGDLQSLERLFGHARELAVLPPHRWDVSPLELGDEPMRKPMGSVTSLLPPTMWEMAVASAEAETWARLARAALAVVAYRSAHATLPSSFGRLRPSFLDAVPIDPFTGRPILLRRDDARLILYSVGPDLTDDAGTKRKTHADQGDIVFCIGASCREHPDA